MMSTWSGSFKLYKICVTLNFNISFSPEFTSVVCWVFVSQKLNWGVKPPKLIFFPGRDYLGLNPCVPTHPCRYTGCFAKRLKDETIAHSKVISIQMSTVVTEIMTMHDDTYLYSPFLNLKFLEYWLWLIGKKKCLFSSVPDQVNTLIRPFFSTHQLIERSTDTGTEERENSGSATGDRTQGLW